MMELREGERIFMPSPRSFKFFGSSNEIVRGGRERERERGERPTRSGMWLSSLYDVVVDSMGMEALGD